MFEGFLMKQGYILKTFIYDPNWNRKAIYLSNMPMISAITIFGPGTRASLLLIRFLIQTIYL